MNEKNSKILDLLIIGHSVKDTIYDGGKITEKFGGIHNVKRSFDFISQDKLTSQAEPSAVGEATIFIDRENSSKEVYADLNKIVRTPKLQKARWYHVSYLNMYRECHYAHDNFITSMDWCGKKEGYVPPNLKYFFISEDDFNVKGLARKHPTIKFVSHSPENASLWTNGDRAVSHAIEKKKGLNILASGDHFAAAFIFYKLSGKTDEEAVEFAIQSVQAWLLYQ